MRWLQEMTYRLAQINEHRLSPGSMADPGTCEIDYIESIRRTNPSPVQTYQHYEDLLYRGPGQNHPLFDWLAEKATMEEMVWFLAQEAAGEAGFGDLVALTLIQMPNRAKLELARNFWDEMGQGKEEGMHDKLLRDLIKMLGVRCEIEHVCWESLLLANVMVALAANRRYAWLSVGALGVIEMTAPGRVAKIDQGLARLGVSKHDRQYFTLHATLDVKHSREWNREIVEPLAGSHIAEIGEGAFLRLSAGSRCYDAYSAHFGLEST